MTIKQQTRLQKSYKKYSFKKRDKNSLLDFFKVFMPEIVFRTMKLEGEKVSKRSVSSLFTTR